ncbi:histidine phosphatase family protein [Streptomyces sp. NPDC003247]|uniref:histidine phosphatase family protein n=1 Tax=Streptomyces sp. NPDC003247 TaxID=3364677 RepID=UPI0036B579A8
MTIRLTLLCASPARTVLGCAPLSERAPHDVGAALTSPPAHSATLRSPSAGSALIAAGLGVRAAVDPALRDIDYGTWRGRTVADVVAADPCGYSSWLTDPDAAPHGGETARQLCRRIAQWLSSLPADTGRTLAIVEAAVAQAVLVHALSAPPRALWKLSVPPLNAVHLTCCDGVWRVQPTDVCPVQGVRRPPPVPLTPLTAPRHRFSDRGMFV